MRSHCTCTHRKLRGLVLFLCKTEIEVQATVLEALSLDPTAQGFLSVTLALQLNPNIG